MIKKSKSFLKLLYLGDTAETAIYDARAGAYDYVTKSIKSVQYFE